MTQAHSSRARTRCQRGLHDLPRRIADGFYVTAHPSTTEEHTKRSDAARAESLIRDTSDDYLQEETEQNRSRKAKTAFNIVFVTSEVQTYLPLNLTPQTQCTAFIAQSTVMTMFAQSGRMHSGTGCALVQDRWPWRCMWIIATCSGSAGTPCHGGCT